METNLANSQFIKAGIYTSRGVSPSSIRLFQKIMLGIAMLALITHALFAAMFFVGGVYPMFWFNLGSMCCYVIVHILTRRGQSMLGWGLTMLEVLLHATAATVFVGWEAGFHWYALLVLPVLLFGYQNLYSSKIPIALALIASYLLLDFFYREATGVTPLPESYTAVLHTLNLGVFVGFLAFLCGLYNIIVVRSEQKLSEYASTDPLTGLRNRRSVLACAEIEASRQRRNGQTISFVICDVDFFKKVNDSVGHDGGDAVLRAVADVLRTSTRLTDYVARFGGEEFLIVLPDASVDKAVVVCERIRTHLESIMRTSEHLKNYAQRLNPITMTFGISELVAGDSWGTYYDAIDRADKLLYEGKRSGRNKVVF